MKLTKKHINKISRKVNRQLELEAGRVSYGRVHKDRTKYDRKQNKKIIQKNLAD
jgi:hypothetical protein